MNVYIGKATDQNSMLGEITVIACTLGFLISYVAYFTVLKFRRIAFEEKEYNKLLMLNITDENKAELMNNLKQVKNDKDFVEGKIGA